MKLLLILQLALCNCKWEGKSCELGLTNLLIKTQMRVTVWTNAQMKLKKSQMVTEYLVIILLLLCC